MKSYLKFLLGCFLLFPLVCYMLGALIVEALTPMYRDIEKIGDESIKKIKEWKNR